MSLDFDNIVVKVDNRIVNLKTSEIPIMVLPQPWDEIPGKPDTFPPSEHNHDDRYYTETEVDALFNANLLTRTTSAGTASAVYISDAADAPVVDLQVEIKPVQAGSGDPAPDNIHLIIGWAGTSVSVNGTPVYISWQAAVGTVYCGSLDVTTGLLTVTHLKTVPVITQLQSSNTHGISNWRCSLSPRGITQTTKLSSYCNTFVQDSTPIADTTREGFMPSGQYLYIRLLSTRASTVAAANEFLSGIGTYVVYELYTPVTYQLDPVEIRTILGNNTVSADTGKIISLTYFTAAGQDISTAIDKAATAETLKTMIAPVESTNVASQNYYTNDILFIGAQLYQATANIPSGGTIVEGTNVKKTTIAKLISKLWETVF